MKKEKKQTKKSCRKLSGQLSQCHDSSVRCFIGLMKQEYKEKDGCDFDQLLQNLRESGNADLPAPNEITGNAGVKRTGRQRKSENADNGSTGRIFQIEDCDFSAKTVEKGSAEKRKDRYRCDGRLQKQMAGFYIVICLMLCCETCQNRLNSAGRDGIAEGKKRKTEMKEANFLCTDSPGEEYFIEETGNFA